MFLTRHLLLSLQTKLENKSAKQRTENEMPWWYVVFAFAAPPTGHTALCAEMLSASVCLQLLYHLRPAQLNQSHWPVHVTCTVNNIWKQH